MNTCREEKCNTEVFGKKLYCNKCLRKRQKLREDERQNLRKNKKESEYEKIYMGHLNQ